MHTWGWKWVNLFVGDRHNRVVESLQKVRDSLVGQEHRHPSQQQVDEDEHHCEEILQAGFAESHRWTVFPDVILCNENVQCGGVKLALKAPGITFMGSKNDYV